MKIEKQIIVNKDIEDVWKVLSDFANPHIWASQIIRSEGKGESFNGCGCSERIIEIKGKGTPREKLTQFSPDKYAMSYTIEGLPEAVTHAINKWQLTSLDEDKTGVDMKMEITLSGFKGKLMQPVMRMMLGKMFNSIMADFKYYVENGRPFSAKLKNK